LIPKSAKIPATSRARLETLTKVFSHDAQTHLFQAIDPGYYLRSDSIPFKFKNEAIEDYLYKPATASQKPQLEIEDVNYWRILPDLTRLEAELEGDGKKHLAQARQVANSLMAWVVKALLDIEKPTSEKGKKLLFKKTLRRQKEALELKFTGKA
jgi:hypothetical protein